VITNRKFYIVEKIKKSMKSILDLFHKEEVIISDGCIGGDFKKGYSIDVFFDISEYYDSSEKIEEFREKNPSMHGLSTLDHAESQLFIYFNKCNKKLRDFSKKKKSCLISAHGGYSCDGSWEMLLPNGRGKLIDEVIEVAINQGYELVYLNACNRQGKIPKIFKGQVVYPSTIFSGPTKVIMNILPEESIQ